MADHSKLIVKLAKATLVPDGLRQKGKSRIFLDDHGWFTTLVEFQPHKWKHGAYLNVGANFNWFVNDYLSFDMGYRVSDFAEFETERQFTSKVQEFVDVALERCRGLRRSLQGLDAARAAIVPFEFTSDSLWGNYHRVLISGLCSDAAAARGYFDALLAVDFDVPWANALKAQSREIVGLLDHHDRFVARVCELVEQSRAAKGLPSMGIVFAS